MQEFPIAILGAGITGLSCARRLQELGKSVVVYDKGRGLGGRAATRRLEPPLAFDHGAQYFTARDPVFQAQVAQWVREEVVADWPGRIVVLHPGSTRETEPQPRYVGIPGMTAIAAHLARNLDIRRETKIVTVQRTADAWNLRSGSGESFGPFTALVVTFPAPQARELLGDYPLADKIDFSPMPCWAVLVAFAERLPTPWDGAFLEASPLVWACRNSSKPGRRTDVDCWVLHAGAEWSTAHLEDEPEAITQLLPDAFATALGRPLPSAISLTAHRWRYALGCDGTNRRCLVDASNKLIIAGDWLADGRLEGAYLAGLEAANRLSAHSLTPSTGG